jgi:hypothetical protein
VDDATAVLNTVVGVEVESADPTGQNVSATSRIEGYLTTVDVRSSNCDDGSDASEYCINGNWHREYEYSSLQQIRDVDEPFRSLHCLVMLKNWYVGMQNGSGQGHFLGPQRESSLSRILIAKVQAIPYSSTHYSIPIIAYLL